MTKGAGERQGGSGDRSRCPIRVVASLPQLDGRLLRIVGSTDARGEGMAFAIPEVGPYVLVGDARGLVGPDLPPFGDHPHAGLLALSFVPSGEAWESRANVPEMRSLAFGAGDVLMTVAGRGIVHDETTVGEGTHDMLQIILRQPAAAREQAAAIRHWRARDDAASPGVRHLYDGEQLAGTGVDAAADLVRVPPGGRVTLPLRATHTAGFVYVRDGALEVGGAAVDTGEVAVLGASGGTLSLMAVGGEPAECLVATAAPIDEPWAKRLGHNGFVVAASAEEATRKLASYASRGVAFGQG